MAAKGTPGPGVKTYPEFLAEWTRQTTDLETRVGWLTHNVQVAYTNGFVVGLQIPFEAASPIMRFAAAVNGLIPSVRATKAESVFFTVCAFRVRSGPNRHRIDAAYVDDARIEGLMTVALSKWNEQDHARADYLLEFGPTLVGLHEIIVTARPNQELWDALAPVARATVEGLAHYRAIGQHVEVYPLPGISVARFRESAHDARQIAKVRALAAQFSAPGQVEPWTLFNGHFDVTRHLRGRRVRKVTEGDFDADLISSYPFGDDSTR